MCLKQMLNRRKIIILERSKIKNILLYWKNFFQLQYLKNLESKMIANLKNKK